MTDNNNHIMQEENAVVAALHVDMDDPMGLDPLGIQVPGTFPTTAIPVPLGLDPLGAGTQALGAFPAIAAQVPPTALNQSMVHDPSQVTAGTTVPPTFINQPDPLAGPISLTGAEASTSSLVALAPPVPQPIISQGILKHARTQESTASGPSSLALIGPLPASLTVLTQHRRDVEGARKVQLIEQAPFVTATKIAELEQKLQDIQREHENAQSLKDAAINTLTIKLTASDAEKNRVLNECKSTVQELKLELEKTITKRDTRIGTLEQSLQQLQEMFENEMTERQREAAESRHIEVEQPPMTQRNAGEQPEVAVRDAEMANNEVEPPLHAPHTADGKGKTKVIQELSDDEDTANLGNDEDTPNVPPPIRMLRPRGGAGPQWQT
ncbi:hypothetical protein BDQ17DRAFT_1422983 [Cyathus striatus]|nr:hypothetical protein BDQ17DRAFT_1422983 [Cyathus striatus]